MPYLISGYDVHYHHLRIHVWGFSDAPFGYGEIRWGWSVSGRLTGKSTDPVSEDGEAVKQAIGFIDAFESQLDNS